MQWAWAFCFEMHLAGTKGRFSCSENLSHYSGQRKKERKEELRK